MENVAVLEEDKDTGKEPKKEPKKEKKGKPLGEAFDTLIQSIRDIKDCLERQGMDSAALPKVMRTKTKMMWIYSS